MTTVAKTSTNAQEKPEGLYRSADAAERRKIQVAVLEANRGRVAALVRRIVRRREHWREAEQVGAIGVLIALEKFEPSLAPEGENAFWATCAMPHVRDEIQRWLDVGVYWRARSKKGAGHAERTGEAGAKLAMHRKVSPLPEVDPADETNVESVVAEIEALGLLNEFLNTLDEEDRKLLLAARRERAEGGVEAGNNARSRRYLSLVERASAFVRGSDDGGHREPVRGHSATVRVEARTRTKRNAG